MSLQWVLTLEETGVVHTFAEQTIETMKQTTYQVADSLGVFHPETIETPGWSLARFFVDGGVSGMIALTLLLIALFLAAWKAPRWVREVGIAALVLSVFLTTVGLFQIFGLMDQFGSEIFPIIGGGLQIAIIPLLYGLIIYFISLLIRLVKTPRI